MAEFIARWFTPSDSDQQSGAQYNAAYNAQLAQMRPAEIKQKEREDKRAKKKTVSKFGGVTQPAPLLATEEAGVAKKMLLGQ